MGITAVVLMAEVFDARHSVGYLLLILIGGDLCAVCLFRKHASWLHLRRLIPPMLIGVVAGWAAMQMIPDGLFRFSIGLLVLALVVLQLLRKRLGDWVEKGTHSAGFPWVMGCGAGASSMMANAAGPVMMIYLLAMKLPKYEFVGTGAWFFLIMNLVKVPFGISLGIVGMEPLLLGLICIPIALVGAWLGKWIMNAISQQLFENLILLFSFLGALRLVLG